MTATHQLLLTLTLQAQRAGHQVTLRMDGDWVLVDHEGCPLRMPLEEAVVYMVDVVGVEMGRTRRRGGAAGWRGGGRGI